MQKVIFFLFCLFIISSCSFKKDNSVTSSKKALVVSENDKNLMLTSEQSNLLEIVSFGTEKDLENFLSQHASLNLNFLNSDGNSPLGMASSSSKTGIAEILIKHGSSFFWDLENTRDSGINLLLARRYRLHLANNKETTMFGGTDGDGGSLIYSTTLSPLELVYEQVVKDISDSLEKNDFLKIRKIQEQNQISCNLLSAIFIEGLQFPKSDMKLSESVLAASEYLKRANCSPSSGSSFSRIIYNFEWIRLLIKGSDQTTALSFILDRFPTTSPNIEDLYIRKIWMKLSPMELFSSYGRTMPDALKTFINTHFSNNRISPSLDNYAYGYGYDKNSIGAGESSYCFIYSLVYGRFDRSSQCTNEQTYEKTDQDE